MGCAKRFPRGAGLLGRQFRSSAAGPEGPRSTERSRIAASGRNVQRRRLQCRSDGRTRDGGRRGSARTRRLVLAAWSGRRLGSTTRRGLTGLTMPAVSAAPSTWPHDRLWRTRDQAAQLDAVVDRHERPAARRSFPVSSLRTPVEAMDPASPGHLRTCVLEHATLAPIVAGRPRHRCAHRRSSRTGSRSSSRPASPTIASRLATDAWSRSCLGFILDTAGTLEPAGGRRDDSTHALESAIGSAESHLSSTTTATTSSASDLGHATTSSWPGSGAVAPRDDAADQGPRTAARQPLALPRR